MINTLNLNEETFDEKVSRCLDTIAQIQHYGYTDLEAAWMKRKIGDVYLRLMCIFKLYAREEEIQHLIAYSELEGFDCDGLATETASIYAVVSANDYFFQVPADLTADEIIDGFYTLYKCSKTTKDALRVLFDFDGKSCSQTRNIMQSAINASEILKHKISSLNTEMVSSQEPLKRSSNRHTYYLVFFSCFSFFFSISFLQELWRKIGKSAMSFWNIRTRICQLENALTNLPPDFNFMLNCLGLTKAELVNRVVRCYDKITSNRPFNTRFSTLEAQVMREKIKFVYVKWMFILQREAKKEEIQKFIFFAYQNGIDCDGLAAEIAFVSVIIPANVRMHLAPEDLSSAEDIISGLCFAFKCHVTTRNALKVLFDYENATTSEVKLSSKAKANIIAKSLQSINQCKWFCKYLSI